MEYASMQSTQLRYRFRSFKYSVSRKTSETRNDFFIKSTNEKKESLINIHKLGSVLKMRGNSNQKHRTISLHEKEDIYVRTYTTFFSKDYLKDTEDKQNQKFKVLIPEYDNAFDETNSGFTLLDTMVKPVKYIEDNLHSSQKELKRQRNDIQMLRSELNALKNGLNERLDEMTATVHSKLAELKESFNRNEVQEQQRKFRHRKEMQILQRGHELDVKMLESLKDRNLDIQDKIFSCHPFELEFKQTAVLQISENQYL